MSPFSFSSKLKPSEKTVQSVVQQLESKCFGDKSSETCAKIYLKLNSECANEGSDSKEKCEFVVELAKKEFCRRNENNAIRLCRSRKTRGTINDYPKPPGGNGSGKNLKKETSTPKPPPTQPIPQPKPPTPVLTPAPPAPATESSSSSSSSGSALLLAGFFFGIFVCIGVCAVIGYLYYTKKQEKEKEELRKKMEQSRQMEKKKRRKMRKKKGKRVIVQEKTGEETKVERREAKEKDREEEEQKWKVFEEANQKENTFLDP